jgi:hypothetical protein
MASIPPLRLTPCRVPEPDLPSQITEAIMARSTRKSDLERELYRYAIRAYDGENAARSRPRSGTAATHRRTSRLNRCRRGSMRRASEPSLWTETGATSLTSTRSPYRAKGAL